MKKWGYKMMDFKMIAEPFCFLRNEDYVALAVSEEGVSQYKTNLKDWDFNGENQISELLLDGFEISETNSFHFEDLVEDNDVFVFFKEIESYKNMMASRLIYLTEKEMRTLSESDFNLDLIKVVDVRSDTNMCTVPSAEYLKQIASILCETWYTVSFVNHSYDLYGSHSEYEKTKDVEKTIDEEFSKNEMLKEIRICKNTKTFNGFSFSDGNFMDCIAYIKLYKFGGGIIFVKGQDGGFKYWGETTYNERIGESLKEAISSK